MLSLPQDYLSDYSFSLLHLCRKENNPFPFWTLARQAHLVADDVEPTSILL